MQPGRPTPAFPADHVVDAQWRARVLKAKKTPSPKKSDLSPAAISDVVPERPTAPVENLAGSPAAATTTNPNLPSCGGPGGDLDDEDLHFSDPFSELSSHPTPDPLGPEFERFVAEHSKRFADKLAQREEQRRLEIEFERNLDALMIQRLDDDGAPASEPSADAAVEPDPAFPPWTHGRETNKAIGTDPVSGRIGDIHERLSALLEELAVEAGKAPEDAHQALINILCGLREAEDAKYAELKEQRQQARWRTCVEENLPYTRSPPCPSSTPRS